MNDMPDVWAGQVRSHGVSPRMTAIGKEIPKICRIEDGGFKYVGWMVTGHARRIVSDEAY